MLEARKVTKKFGEKYVWKDLDLKISSGEMVAITGESGSGKTTLLNVLGLLESLNSGSIHLDGKDITNTGVSGKKKLYRDVYAFLFQNYGLIDNWSIEQNLLLALEYSKLSKKDKENKINGVLQQVKLGYAKLSQAIYSLSGGEQQRVALARAILKEANIILCDEPSAALDAKNTQICVDILKDLAHNKNITVVISTHDSLVVEQCDRVVEL